MTLDTQLSKGTLLKGLVGILPIPIVGEVGLSMFFYELLKGKSTLNLEYAGIPAALLTRYFMWTDFYIPIYEKLKELL